MKRAVIVLAMLSLCGCYSDEAKNEGFCELDTMKFSAQHFDKYDERLIKLKEIQMMHACMQRHGYRRKFSKYCPVEEKGIDLLVTASVNSTNIDCYEPVSWGARQAFLFERWVKSWT